MLLGCTWILGWSTLISEAVIGSNPSLQNLWGSIRLDGECRCTGIFISLQKQVQVGAMGGLLKDIHRVIPEQSHRVTLTEHQRSLTKALLSQSLSLAGRVLVFPNFFNFRMMETTVLIGNFNAAEIPLYPSADLCFYTSMSQAYRQFPGLHGLVCALTCTVNCGTCYRQVLF